jgi:hypothetical protein
MNTGKRVSVTGWGYTVTATVTAAAAREVIVDHPDRDAMTFTLRGNGSWVLKNYATTYAPKLNGFEAQR